MGNMGCISKIGKRRSPMPSESTLLIALRDQFSDTVPGQLESLDLRTRNRACPGLDYSVLEAMS
jgi:hypothetical protein